MKPTSWPHSKDGRCDGTESLEDAPQSQLCPCFLWQKGWPCFQQRETPFNVLGEKHIFARGFGIPGAHNLIDLQLVNFLLTLISNGSHLAPAGLALGGGGSTKMPGLVSLTRNSITFSYKLSVRENFLFSAVSLFQHFSVQDEKLLH